MRMLTADFDLFSGEPHTDLLSRRSRNEAYCTAQPGVAYAVFFPDGGDVDLDVSEAAGHAVTLRWLQIRESRWADEPRTTHLANGDRSLRLQTPTEEGYWAALIHVV